MSKASVVLLKYKRIKELEEIVDYLKHFDNIFTEFIIWDNTVINMCGLGRYLCALQAKNDIIFTCDDDCIPLNIPELWAKYKELKSQGKEQIVNSMKSGAMKNYKNLGQTMVGWGSFFPKKAVNVLNEYINVYGIDDLLIRDASRIFTGLYGKWHSLPSKIKEFPSASDPKIALWLQKNHKSNRVETIKRINHLKLVR